MPKYNIYKINKEQQTELSNYLISDNVGLKHLKSIINDDYVVDFYFSKKPDEVDIWWCELYKEFLEEDIAIPKNNIYYAAMLVHNKDHCYAISLGKTHFYIRKYCDIEFGMNVAERIIDEHSLKLKNAKYHQSKRNKTITSYRGSQSMDFGSGESMDLLKAKPCDTKKWGNTVTFGTSVLLNINKQPHELPSIIQDIENALKGNIIAQIPRTHKIVNSNEINNLDARLGRALLNNSEPISTEDFAVSGVDFVFSTRNDYSLYIRNDKQNKSPIMELTVENIYAFIKSRNINIVQDIDNLYVDCSEEFGRSHGQKLKEFIDVIFDNYCLMNGEWHVFNKAYIDYIRTRVDKIKFEYKSEFNTHERIDEGKFNADRGEEGFKVLDKLNERVEKMTIEIADLYKNECLYFVKFGEPGKLSYVVDQCQNSIHVIEQNALPIPYNVKKICLWVGLARKSYIDKLSDINSIIFLTKLIEWDRTVKNAGYEPIIWFHHIGVPKPIQLNAPVIEPNLFH